MPLHRAPPLHSQILGQLRPRPPRLQPSGGDLLARGLGELAALLHRDGVLQLHLEDGGAALRDRAPEPHESFALPLLILRLNHSAVKL